jgi:hypothetical protein
MKVKKSKLTSALIKCTAAIVLGGIAGGAFADDVYQTITWNPTQDKTNATIEYPIASNGNFVTGDKGSWDWSAYTGGTTVSFGGGTPSSKFLTSYYESVDGSNASDAVLQNTAKQQAEDIVSGISNKGGTSPDMHLDFDIEETYSSPNGYLLTQVKGQRYYGYFINEMAKQAKNMGWTINVDIQQPFLSLPFRGLYGSCLPATESAAWMPCSSDESKNWLRGGKPYYNVVLWLILNNTSKTQGPEKLTDPSKLDPTTQKPIAIDLMQYDNLTWTMMGYPLSGIWDLTNPPAPGTPYTTKAGNIDVKRWLNDMLFNKTFPAGSSYESLTSLSPVVANKFTKQFIYATQSGTANQGHVSGGCIYQAYKNLPVQPYGVAFWEAINGWSTDDKKAAKAVDDFFSDFKTGNCTEPAPGPGPGTGTL